MDIEKTKVNIFEKKDDWEKFRSSLYFSGLLDIEKDEVGIAVYFSQKASKSYVNVEYKRNGSDLTVFWDRKKEKIQVDKDKTYLISLVNLDNSQVKYQIKTKPKTSFFKKIFKR